MKGGEPGRALLIGIKHDIVVTLGVGRPKANNPARDQPLFRDESPKHRLGIREQSGRRFTIAAVGEDTRESALDLPGREEGRPIDVRHEEGEIIVLQDVRPGKRGPLRLVARPVKLELVRARSGKADTGFLGASTLMGAGNRLVSLANFFHIRVATVAQESGNHANRAACVGHIDRLVAPVIRTDLYRSMDLARSRATDKKRNIKALPFHLGRDKDHFVEAWRYQPGKPDHIGFQFACLVEDDLRRHHHAEVDHVIIVALKHNADDVLADVVDVTLHRRHDDAPCGGCVFQPRFKLFGFHKRHQIRDRLLHDPRRLHHLRQKHLACAEKIANDVHAVHERAFDHMQRPYCREASFFRILVDVIGDAVNEGVFEAFGDRAFAPPQIRRLLFGATAFEAIRGFQQAVSGIGAPV